MAFDNDIQKELEDISPFLSRLPKNNPYKVPPGYFDQFAASIPAAARQATIVPFAPKRNMWRVAMAAAIAGIIILGGWFFMQKRPAADTFASVEKQMQQVSDTEMAAYV